MKKIWISLAVVWIFLTMPVLAFGGIEPAGAEMQLEENINVGVEEEERIYRGDEMSEVSDGSMENETDEDTGQGFYINPLYEDVLTEDDLRPIEKKDISYKAREVLPVFSDADDIAAYIRSNMVEREAQFSFVWMAEDDTKQESAMKKVMKMAVMHTGIPDEGDYLNKHWGGYKYQSNTYAYGENVGYCYTISYTYHTNRSQEDEVDRKVEEILSNLDLKEKSDYEKVEKIYDYLCSEITYDYENLDDDQYVLKYTAYAGLIQNTCVCQGYASILYRLCLEAGIDVRVISGWTSTERKPSDGHCWNIINISGTYYYADATWDAGKAVGDYDYFLECWTSFNSPYSHEDYYNDPEKDVNGIPIYQNYNIANTDFWIDQGSCGDNLIWKLSEDGTLKINGTGTMDEYGYQKFPWSAYSKSINRIIFDSGITSIAVYAFYGFEEVSELDIPDSVIEIGRNAFTNCTNLKKIRLPSKLNKLSESVLEECDSLSSISIPDSVTEIEAYAFMGCNALSVLTIPEKVQKIGDGAFLGSGINTFLFTGTIPEISDNVRAFEEVTATIFYPNTWSYHPDVEVLYGSLTWKRCQLGNCTINIASTNYVYDGNAKEPEITVKAGGLTLVEGVDYSVLYQNNVNVGNATAIILGKGLWEETRILNYTIEKMSPSLLFTKNEIIKTYGDEAFENELIQHTNGSIKYESSNINVAVIDSLGRVTINGAGKTIITVTASSTAIYEEGQASYILNVKPRITACNYAGIYDGMFHTAEVLAEGNAELYYSAETQLDYNNYKIAGSKTMPERKSAGETEIYYIALPKTDVNSDNVVQGSIWIKISQKNNTITASNIKENFSLKTQTVNIEAKANDGAALTFSSDCKSLTVSADGKVKIAPEFVGKATITITAAATVNYKTATKKITLSVNPAGTKLLKITRLSKNKVRVKWKKNKQVSGYQIQYSTDKKFRTIVKRKNITKKKITSVRLSKLKKGKRYYVRIRTYKKVGGIKYYSSWSSCKRIKLK